MQVFGGIDQSDNLLSDLWYVDTSHFTSTYTRAWTLLTPSSLQTPKARHSFGMVVVDQRIVVMGGWVRTTGTGSLRSNDMWTLEHKPVVPLANSTGADSGNATGDSSRTDDTAVWTSTIPDGATYTFTPRNNFAAVSIGVTVAVLGGEGNTGLFADIHHTDLCSSVECGPRYKSTCDWSVTSSQRGACIPCKEGENCCRTATFSATEGLCADMSVTLNSCAQSDVQWDSLVQATAMNVFMNGSNCTDYVQDMCSSISAPGIPQGTSRKYPLLCQRPFLCSSHSAFGTLRFTPTRVCGIAGTECTTSNKPNRMCCSYIEHLIANSCDNLPAQFVAYLARSRFPSCRDVGCYSPAIFQVTTTALNVDQEQDMLSLSSISSTSSISSRRSTSSRRSGGSPTSLKPSARDGMAAAVIGTSMYMYGGYVRAGEYVKELWELRADVYPPTWYDFSGVRGGPSIGRRHAAAAALEPAAKMIVHAGEGPEFLFNDLYVLDVRRPSLDMPYSWIDLTSVVAGDVPSERCKHAMVSVGASEAYTFGGKTLLGITDEVNSLPTSMYVYVCVIP
jgi:hypothetical protein